MRAEPMRREASESERVMRELDKLLFIGFEDDSDDSEEETEDTEVEDELEEEDEDESEDDDASNAAKAATEERERLSGALKKERTARRNLQKELKELKKQQPGKPSGKPGEEDADAISAATAAATAQEQAKSERLAGKLLTNAVNLSITKIAGELKFVDVEDAIAQVNRKDIEVDQDDDEPDQVEVDEASVKEALKALAKKKPYLITKTDKAGTKTGDKFGGKGNKASKSEEDLMRKYPALGRAR